MKGDIVWEFVSIGFRGIHGFAHLENGNMFPLHQEFDYDL